MSYIAERQLFSLPISSPVQSAPFPHLLVDDFLAAEDYQALRESFPSCPSSTGPTGFSLYWGDEGYTKQLEIPVWKDLFQTFHSQGFIDSVVALFGDTWKKDGCKIDLSRATYVPYQEHRIDKELRHLRKVEHLPHELWIRMDIHQGKAGYQRKIHLDHRRRLVSLLFYLYDHQENELDGGELLLHKGKRQGWLSAKPVKVVPRHNRMVMFPCSARSFHSVPMVKSLKAPRNFLQVVISSSVDAW